MLVTALLVVLTLLVIYNVKRVMARRPNSPLISVTSPLIGQSETKETSPAPEGESLTGLKQKAKEMKWDRDPFILSIEKGEELPTLQLKVTGIIYDEARPEATYAIINDQVIRIGDSIDGIRVIDIQADAVQLKKFDRQFTLYLYQETNKK